MDLDFWLTFGCIVGMAACVGAWLLVEWLEAGK